MGDQDVAGLDVAMNEARLVSRVHGARRRLDELHDVTLEVTKRTRGDYTNVYFNRRIQIAASSNGAAPQGDMPF